MCKKITFILLFSCLFGFAKVVPPAVLYVDASKPDNSGNGLSWATAKKDIQNAIDLAGAGSQVWVKAGVYYPNASPNMTASTTVTATSPLTPRDYYIQLKTGVSIFGGFSGTETALSQRIISDNPTYIDGDIGVPGDITDNCYHLMIYVGTYSTSGVTVDGLVLRNGNATRLAASTNNSEETYIFANGFDNPIPRRIGGGLYVGRGLNNTISNIVFENNECEVFGAALYLYGISGTFCTFNVFNCYFVNNRLSGSPYGAMCSDGGIVNCYNSVFYNNSCGIAGGDGVALNLIRTKNKLVNCTFANNQSYTGSALSIQSSETTEIYNCIFNGNTRTNTSFAATSGYDFRQFFSGPVPIIKNCSLMHPSANYTAANYTEMDASSSGNLYEQAPSFSNINNLKGADSKYFTADDGLALLTTSPSKNTGLNSLLPSILTVDITYASRILATNVDMGAYEVDGVMSLSDTILAQIGNEGDSPNTIPSVVTTTQLSQIVPAITGIVEANEATYQGYIDANPDLFSTPATAAEVQTMVTAVNAQVVAQAASNAVLVQIGNEADSPNVVFSTVTTTQLGLILPAITGIVAANELYYQGYIEDNPNSFGTPATAAEVQAMINAVNATVIAQNNVLTQIGNEADAPNTLPSAVTIAQLGQIITLTEPIIAANLAGYQAYIDAYPNLFSAPATSSEVDSMLYDVNYSYEILAQIGNEGDAPNTVSSVVTTTQLGAILPAITEIVAANQAAYQAYIDANPSLFSAPATAAEVQAMITAVNAQVVAQAASNAVLVQIGNEGDAPNTVSSVVTTTQLGAILPAITGIVEANQTAYQAYIDANPSLFSAPATAAEVQAMVTAVNTALSVNIFNIDTVVVYPNPSNAIFNIEIETNTTFELYDMIGKRLKSDKIAIGTTALNLSDYSDGVYFLRITNEINQIKTIRLIKK